MDEQLTEPQDTSATFENVLAESEDTIDEQYVADLQKGQGTEIGNGASQAEAVVPPPAVPAPEIVTPTPAPETVQAEAANRHVPLSVVQAERAKRQQLAQEVDYLRQQLQQAQGGWQQPTEMPVQAIDQGTDQKYQNQMLAMSEYQARKSYPDFNEKYLAFQEAAATDPALLDSVLTSTLPGEAAYQAGKHILIQKKYGSDPDAMIKKVKAETEAELRNKLRAELETELTGKVKQRNQTPTNILSQRAASGAQEAEWQPSSFDDALGRKKK